MVNNKVPALVLVFVFVIALAVVASMFSGNSGNNDKIIGTWTKTSDGNSEFSEEQALALLLFPEIDTIKFHENKTFQASLLLSNISSDNTTSMRTELVGGTWEKSGDEYVLYSKSGEVMFGTVKFVKKNLDITIYDYPLSNGEYVKQK